ncbi:hypothetical protein OEB99_12790 [Actinotalea sp. M2MS4P-6]|uniref:hypothetical protein n=1 Tax=Actinotalea sp. M2MS4P-6 TaxID=2983762 RepID=UPI0021E3AD15|nr:hypothetical protein [Actinotalea sp. M2MS4P-6]MCV2395187.1 hypothetical protein [Actinotalea sp. M2MS4P-6]
MYRIVESLSGETRGHAGRYLLTALGLVCLVVAFAAWIVLIALVTVPAIMLGTGDLSLDDATLDAGLVATIAVSALLGFVMWRLGVRLIRGQRHLVLYLRKFGFTGASAAMSSAIASGLGARWRLVTLDDNDAAPLGVASGRRWVVRLLRLALVALAVYLVFQAVQWLQSDPMGDVAGEAADAAVEQARAEGESEFGAAIQGIFAGAFAAAIGALMVGLVVVFFGLLIAVPAAGGLALTAVGRSARQAERSKAIAITRESQVEPTCRRLRRRVRRVLAPRITIARVADRLWQLVVLRLAATSDAVIVDMSFPTENLVWEVSSMLRARAWVMLVGRRDRLAAIAADPAPAAVELRRLLGEREVVGYDPDDLEAFSVGLRRSFGVLDERIRTAA